MSFLRARVRESSGLLARKSLWPKELYWVCLYSYVAIAHGLTITPLAKAPLISCTSFYFWLDSLALLVLILLSQNSNNNHVFTISFVFFSLLLNPANLQNHSCSKPHSYLLCIIRYFFSNTTTRSFQATFISLSFCHFLYVTQLWKDN